MSNRPNRRGFRPALPATEGTRPVWDERANITPSTLSTNRAAHARLLGAGVMEVPAYIDHEPTRDEISDVQTLTKARVLRIVAEAHVKALGPVEWAIYEPGPLRDKAAADLARSLVHQPVTSFVLAHPDAWLIVAGVVTLPPKGSRP